MNAKYIHLISTYPKFLTHANINFKSKIPSKYHRFKMFQISYKSSKLGMGEILCMIHPGKIPIYM